MAELKEVVDLLAGELIDEFSDEGIVRRGDLKKALSKLFDIQTIAEPIRLKSRLASKIVDRKFVRDAINSIMSFQDSFGLEDDGLIGPLTLDFIKTGLKKKLKHKTPKKEKTEPVQPEGTQGKGKQNIIRWFVDGDLPDLDKPNRAIGLLRKAWRKWEANANFTQREVSDPSIAEVIIRQEPFPGGARGAELARATVGPPRGQQMLFRIDDAEPFSTETSQGSINFEAMCIHEIGHLLGLGHNSNQGSVMFDTHQPGMRMPQQVDIDAVAKILG